VAWSPDGEQLASCGGGATAGELLVWNPAKGELLTSIPGITSVVSKVAWSHDSKVLLGGSIAGSIHWWDVASGAEIQHRQSHFGWVHSLSVSPDGSMLASSGEDGVIHLLDIQHAELIRAIRMDRPYERMDISSLSGITDAQRATLMALGATERSH
jgi:WD40 repeat protein